MTEFATHPSFHGHLNSLRQGDDDAATWIWNHYVADLVSLAQRHLYKQVRGKVDADDVVNSAFKSFFVGFRKGHYELPNPESLWGLLKTITERKCSKQHKHYFGRECRRVDREIAIQQDGEIAWGTIDCDGTPSEPAKMAETLRKVMHDFDSRKREIVELRMNGCSTEEISQKTACTKRTVQRILQRVKTRLQAMIEQPPEE